MSFIKRVSREYQLVVRQPVENVTISVDEDDIMTWNGYITGPPNTPFAGGNFDFTLTFPNDYPFKAPKFLLKTRIFHPNVDNSGKMCLSTINDWAPNKTAKDILAEVVTLMVAPNPDNPVEASTAELFKSNYNSFYNKALEWTSRYA